MKTKPKTTMKDWKKQNKSAQNKLKQYRKEERKFMKEGVSPNKKSKLKQL